MAYDCPNCKTPLPDAVSKGEHEKKLGEVQAKLDTTVAGHTAALQQASAASERALAYARAGLDDEGAAVAELLYGKLPEQGRPALADYLTAQKAAPSKALAGYFAAPAPTPAPAAPAPAGAPAAAPLPPGPPGPQGAPPQGAPPAFTVEQIRGMSGEELLASLPALEAATGKKLAHLLGPQSPTG